MARRDEHDEIHRVLGSGLQHTLQRASAAHSKAGPLEDHRQHPGLIGLLGHQQSMHVRSPDRFGSLPVTA